MESIAFMKSIDLSGGRCVAGLAQAETPNGLHVNHCGCGGPTQKRTAVCPMSQMLLPAGRCVLQFDSNSLQMPFVGNQAVGAVRP